MGSTCQGEMGRHDGFDTLMVDAQDDSLQQNLKVLVKNYSEIQQISS